MKDVVIGVAQVESAHIYGLETMLGMGREQLSGSLTGAGRDENEDDGRACTPLTSPTRWRKCCTATETARGGASRASSQSRGSMQWQNVVSALFRLERDGVPQVRSGEAQMRLCGLKSRALQARLVASISSFICLGAQPVHFTILLPSKDPTCPLSAMESLRPALTTLRGSVPRRGPAARPLYHCLHIHTSATRGATPLPHPSVPGPPPETPSPQLSSDAAARVARKRRQADMMKQAREMREVYAPSNKPKSMLAKRFWKDVHVKEAGGGLQVYLDHRPVRMPNKEILTVPLSKHQLATAIALEWDLLMSAQQALKNDYIPMTSLAARAIDIAAADAEGRENVRHDIMRYFLRVLSTDTLLCWAPEKVLNEVKQNGKTLRELQEEVAMKIIAYLKTHVWPGVEILPTLDPDSIIPVAQPEMTQQVIRGWCSGLPAFELAGLERAVLASKSLLVSARLIHEWGEAFAQSRPAADGARFGIEEAAEAASLEVRWQTGQWGEVEDTHDVEKEDLRRQLGSAVILVGGNSS